MRDKVLLPQDIAEVGKEYLRDHGYEVKMGSGIREVQIADDIADCSAVIARLGDFTEQVIESGTGLKIIARHGAGYDNIDLKAARKRGIWVTNDPISNINAVAEHVIAMILGSAKHLAGMDEAVRNGNFKARNERLSTEVSGKTLGIVGYGRIGRLAAAKAGQGLGMKILAYDVFTKSDGTAVMEESLDRLLKQADFVSLHTPLTEETRGFFGMEQFRKMKPSAYFINAARGELVREDELAEALRLGYIAGAALDVFGKEPPEPDNPLLSMKQVLLSPHNAALTNEAMDEMALTAAQAVDALLSGERPEHVVVEGKNW